MTNEPEKSASESEWTMPNPIFRSSDGHDLRAEPLNEGNVVGNEEVTENPEIKMENESKREDAATDPDGQSAVEKEVRGDKLGASMTVIGLLALLGAAVIFLLAYYLLFRPAAP
jgi:hypothetical protein